MIEIRWHGRAGQGAKTASQLLAATALASGRQVQAFPEYGPERSGAPMRAYTRIDDKRSLKLLPTKQLVVADKVTEVPLKLSLS